MIDETQLSGETPLQINGRRAAVQELPFFLERNSLSRLKL
jgi:hypothetical protein